jgi:hypothetical protein
MPVSMLMLNTDMCPRETAAELGSDPKREPATRTVYLPGASLIEYRPIAFVRV